MRPHLNTRRGKDPLDDYRITSEIEILDLLRKIEESRALITLSSPEGLNYSTVIWNIDADRNLLSFSADKQKPSLRTLLESEEVSAVSYLDSIKVQFDVDGLVLVHGTEHSTLNAQYPTELYRFQRRTSFRVKPSVSALPTASFVHPQEPEAKLALRVLDVSLGGLALFLPDGAPSIPDGTLVENCELQLDEDTQLDVSFVMRHATTIHPQTHGSRLGCEFVNISEAERELQRYINMTQKRQLALGLRKL